MADEELKAKQLALVRKRTDKTVKYYCNDSVVSHSKWEVQLSFGQILMPEFNMGAEPLEQLEVEQGVIVLMTLEHAEAFLKALTTNIARAKSKKAATVIETEGIEPEERDIE